ncbi:MAG: DUF4870 domain-containing protein [Methanohalobium sp.]|uniref:DUF4870 domain-containing protein n=1 Tax=Methanohalobium sp. TaxID=2837493 RepID=UPI00397D11E6
MTYRTAIKLNENIVGLLCYLGFWLTGVLFLLIENNNKFVQFHALQSFLTFLPLTLFIFLVAWVPFVGWLLAEFVGFGVLLIMLILAFQAYRGSKFRLPFVGNIAYNYIYK